MIFFLIVLAALAIFLQQRMGAKALESLDCSIRAENYLVEPREPFGITVTLENRSRLPVLYLRMRFSVPNEAEILPGQRGILQHFAHTSEYRFDCFLLPHQQIQRTVNLVISKRGGYRFSDLQLFAGDFLGLKESSDTYPGRCEVVILPRRPEKAAQAKVLGGLMGERSVNRWIHEDPVLSAGFREYTGREPQKLVSWNRSLQSGRLMVRQMDHTAEEKVTVLLNLDCGSWDDREDCFCLCRSVCESLEEKHLSYAFLHNGRLMTSVGILPAIEPGLGRNNLQRILEGLGRATPECSSSLTTLAHRVIARGQDSGCFLLITPEVNTETRRAARLLESRTGGTVEIISREASV